VLAKIALSDKKITIENHVDIMEGLFWE
jgi:hypothetical protein